MVANEALPITTGNNIKLSASVKTGKEAHNIFNTLSADGNVTLPPTETFYSVFHGAVTDKFNILSPSCHISVYNMDAADRMKL